jgi:hypothetical protein
MALALENWTPVRQDILNALDQQRQYELLARLYVHDEVWNAAWEALAQLSTLRSPVDRDVGTGRSRQS